jgi:hypothetical protein
MTLFIDVLRDEAAASRLRQEINSHERPWCHCVSEMSSARTHAAEALACGGRGP